MRCFSQNYLFNTFTAALLLFITNNHILNVLHTNSRVSKQFIFLAFVTTYGSLNIRILPAGKILFVNVHSSPPTNALNWYYSLFRKVCHVIKVFIFPSVQI